MVGILLRKQLAEMYKSYFYDSKKGTLRSKGAVLLRFGGFALLMVVLFGGFFGYISYLLCDPFALWALAGCTLSSWVLLLLLLVLLAPCLILLLVCIWLRIMIYCYLCQFRCLLLLLHVFWACT